MKRRSRRKTFTARSIPRIARVALSILMLLGAFLLFVTLEASLAFRLKWIAGIQILPLILTGGGSLLVLWLVATMLFGRVYCSSVCPLGTMQDCFSRLRRPTRKLRRKRPFHYAPPHNWLRYITLGVVALAGALGFILPVALIDPYSAFGRIASELLQPLMELCYGYPVVVASWLAFSVAAVTLITIGWIAYRHGRLYCNTLCPVGATLSIFSRNSLFHFDIDTDRCVNCRLCEYSCKAKCINLQDHVVDGSRCVACFDCIDACTHSAITYTTRRKQLSIPMLQAVKPAPGIKTSDAAISDAASDFSEISETSEVSENSAPSAPVLIDRRKFLATGLLVALAPAVSALAGDTRRIKPLSPAGKAPEGLRAVIPPGSRSRKDFIKKCTSCGLCVAHCPAQVLKPAGTALGIANLMHPILHLNASYCRYNCTRCSNICPTGALEPLTREEKHKFVIGKAVTDPSRCIGCGLCAQRCPRKALEMTPRTQAVPGPSRVYARLDANLCIGCGACQYICPATPVKAIAVSGTL